MSRRWKSLSSFGRLRVNSILSITHVKQSRGGIHETTEVAEGEAARAGGFERIAPGRVSRGVGDFSRGIGQLALGIGAVSEGNNFISKLMG